MPYLFADSWSLLRDDAGDADSIRVSTSALPYRAYLVLIATVPMLGLFVSFRQVQMLYTVTGALFFPVLALVLLVFNGRTSWVGKRFANKPLTAALLIGVLGFFSWAALQS